jgi:hypothetical protein
MRHRQKSRADKHDAKVCLVRESLLPLHSETLTNNQYDKTIDFFMPANRALLLGKGTAASLVVRRTGSSLAGSPAHW